MKIKRLNESNLYEKWYYTVGTVPTYFVYDSKDAPARQQLASYSRAYTDGHIILSPVPGNSLPNPLPAGAIVVTDQNRTVRDHSNVQMTKTINPRTLVTKGTDSIDVNSDTRFLFHHLNGREWDNSPNNVIAIPYNDDAELKLINFAHAAIHYLYPIPNSETIPIYEWDGTDWIRRDLIITVN